MSRAGLGTLDWQRLLAHADRLDRIECDCGRPKLRNTDDSCQHCAFLDGGTASDADLIEALRTGIEMTTNELADMFGVHPTGMQRRLARLLEAGRVTRRWREVEGTETVQRCRYGTGMQRAVTGGSARWVYMLTARGR